MAGIAFALRQLVHQDVLTSSLRGYSLAALVSCGPWLFTVLALGGFELLGRGAVSSTELAIFSTVVTYNFSFSLVIAGPIVLVITRLVADGIFLRNITGVPGMLIGSMMLLVAVQSSLAWPFYGWVVNLTTMERLLAVASFHLIGAIWLTTAFLSALKSYASIAMAFGVGMVTALGCAAYLIEPLGASGALTSFSIGLTIVLYILVARILAEYPHPVVEPLSFLSAFRAYWQLALFGFFYNAAIWADKWVMWFSPEAEVVAGAMPTFPVYDGAMFMAQLSLIPAMAVFVISIETKFFEAYRRFYDDIGYHATLDQIHRNHSSILRIMIEAFRNVTVLQCVVCYLAILVAPVVIRMAHGGLEMIPIFRIGTLAAFFHVLLLFSMVIMSYFDMRGHLLTVSVTFFITNGLFTAGILLLGSEFYGFGYFLSALASLALAYILLTRAVARLPYMTFIANNHGLG